MEVRDINYDVGVNITISGEQIFQTVDYSFFSEI
jgi:hypothetical protein